MNKTPCPDCPNQQVADKNEKLLRLADVIEVTAISKSEIRRMELRGEFPKRIQIGANKVRWRQSQIQNWINELVKLESK